MNDKQKKRVCLGAFAGAHGVKGATQIKSFTETPENIGDYGPVETQDGERSFTLSVIRSLKPGLVLATAPEIESREDAQTLKGMRIYIDRDALPPTEEDAFYHEDLIGLNAFDEAGATLGRVKAVYNFGAGDLLELTDIPDVNGVRVIPFTKETAPSVDPAAGRITILRAAVTAEDKDSDERRQEK